MIVFMNQLLRCSSSMAVVALLYLLASHFLVVRYSPKGFYYSGLLILLGFIIPFRPQIPILVPIGDEIGKLSKGAAMVRNVYVVTRDNTWEHQNNITEGISLELMQIVFIVWLVGAISMLIYHGIRHAHFLKTVRRWSTDVSDQQTLAIFHEVKAQMGITSHIGLKKCVCLGSPMLIQLLHPTILLPEEQPSYEELKFILSHELIHFKRRDLLIKSALVLAVAINWFNPVIYLFAKAITHFCELSCDEAVAEKLSKCDKQLYALAIIRAANRYSKQHTALSTHFYGGKETMKNRISIITSNPKKSIGIFMLAACFAFTFILGSITAYADPTGAEITYPILIAAKTDAEIEQEMRIAFTEEFNYEFNEANFPEMIITYDEDGIPILYDTTIPVKKAVYAAGKYEKNGFYSDSSCNNLLFYVKGSSVKVIDSSNATTAAKVKFAGSTGYMKKSELKF